MSEGADPAGPTSAPMRPLFIPRGLVMLASGWVFASWLLIFGLRPPVQPQAASYGPNIQMLLVMIGVGIAIAWPLVRLSGAPSRAPLAQSAIDGISLLVLLQVVIWPLRLVTSWTLPRTVAVVAAAAAAIMLVAAVLALSMRARSGRTRAAWMAALCALALLPMAADAACALLPDESDSAACSAALSPWMLPWSAPALLARFSEPSTIDPGAAERAVLVRAFAFASAIWLVSAIASLAPRGPREAAA